MKSKFQFLCLVLALFAGIHQTAAQGTAFIYQGRLNNGTNPAGGNYDLRFALYGTLTGGSPVAGPLTNVLIPVTNGLLMTTIDFGANVFTNGSNWLEVAVRTNGNGTFNMLAPRQPLAPAPYAITAESLAAVSDFNTNLPGQFATLGGGEANTTSGQYATVGGGYQNNSGTESTVGGGVKNSALGLGGTVGGGDNNTVTSDDATVAGALVNTASGEGATVGGGQGNTASGIYSTVGGGFDNGATQQYATVAGGYENAASGEYGMVCGGLFNAAQGAFSFAAGQGAQAVNTGSFVWNDSSGGNFSSTANNQFSVHATGGVVLACDVHIGTSQGDYHHMSLGGGNSYGYLYGSYPALGDGIHLGYNYYYDAAGTGHVVNSGGAVSRISAGYGTVTLATGPANQGPIYNFLTVSLTGVTVTGTFNNDSDRNVKQDFAPVSPSQILDGVAHLPVSEWSYKYADAVYRADGAGFLCCVQHWHG